MLLAACAGAQSQTGYQQQQQAALYGELLQQQALAQQASQAQQAATQAAPQAPTAGAQVPLERHQLESSATKRCVVR